MNITYKNTNIEKLIIAINVITATIVAITFALLLGFREPLLPRHTLHSIQIAALVVFVGEKIIRFFNASSKKQFLRAFWFEIPLLLILAGVILCAGRIFAYDYPVQLRMAAVWVYLVIQVIDKICRSVISLAALGSNPTRILIGSFLLIILTGTGLLMLPRSYNCPQMSFIDALFTATSSTCVTGLIVKDTGTDFTWTGQGIILAMIQLGGLGIVIFGAIFSLLLGQALGVRESVAMKDLLSAETLGEISKMIAFVFITTIVVELIGAVCMHGLWSGQADIKHPWFYSLFHSVSAFCNAGFSLHSTSLIGFRSQWQTYAVFCSLIILGGLGFVVLYNISAVITDRIKRYLDKASDPQHSIKNKVPRRLSLQSKIVITVSFILIISGAALLFTLENFSNSENSLQSPPAANESQSSFQNAGHNFKIRDAFFQSVTARTAGFNTVEIGNMSSSARFVLILLMFIGGSPGSTAGGIKTVTFTVIIMACYAVIRKRAETEIFKRSIKNAIVGRAILVTLLFTVVLIGSALALSITERGRDFTFDQIAFEAASGLGTVGLSTGITASLTTMGKVIIIILMLVGRLGPLTLLASVTFNWKPAKYNYPDEALIVG